MYVFKRGGQEVAAQEWPVWVQLQENGCYGLCAAADAQGRVVGEQRRATGGGAHAVDRHAIDPALSQRGPRRGRRPAPGRRRTRP